MSGPDFDELAGGDDLTEAERERLLRVHDLLIAAGPPPELPPQLASAPAEPKASVIPIHRHRWRSAGIAVAATLLIAFGAGWLIGGRGDADHAERTVAPVPERTVAMTGPSGARASLDVFSADAAGNWPMVMTVKGLPALPRGRTYTLWLTKEGELEAPCGTFVVGNGKTTVRLNAPYHLKEYSGWVVVVSGTTKTLLRTEQV